MNGIEFSGEMGYMVGVVALTVVAAAMPTIVSCVSDYANRFWEDIALQGRAGRFLMAELANAFISDMENFRERPGRYELTPQAARFVPGLPRPPAIRHSPGNIQLVSTAAPAA